MDRFSADAIRLEAAAPGLRVRELDLDADSRWDDFVASHPEGLVYHSSAWLRALANEYGQPPVALACETSAGELRGVLPLLETRGLPLARGPLTGRRLSSLPRTPVAGPLAADRAAAAELVGAAVELVRARPGVQLQLKVEEARLDGLADGLAGAPWRMAYVVDLPGDPDALRFGDSRNHARIRWAVGKAGKLGVQVRAAETPADLEAWYRLYLETMRFHVLPPRPYRFFAALWELLRPIGSMELLLAEQGHELLAGSVFLLHGRTAFYAFNGRRRESLSLRPNDLLLWHAMRSACARGFARFDLGEVAAGRDGLADFKRKWGAAASPLHRYYYPGAAAVEAADAGGGPGKLAAAVWRRMPLGATARAGNLVYRFL